MTRNLALVVFGVLVCIASAIAFSAIARSYSAEIPATVTDSAFHVPPIQSHDNRNLVALQ